MDGWMDGWTDRVSDGWNEKDEPQELATEHLDG